MTKRSKADQAAFDLAVDQLGGGAPPERLPPLRRRRAKRVVKAPSVVDLTKKGATARYHEIIAELAVLRKVFPHLRYGSAVSPSMPDAVEEPKGNPPRRPRARKRLPANKRR